MQPQHKKRVHTLVHPKPHTTTNKSNQKLPKITNLFSTGCLRNAEQLIVRRENVMLKYALTLQLLTVLKRSLKRCLL